MAKESSNLETPIIAIAGWKNSGKTTLAVRLIEELTRRAWRVAAVKHAHHDFQIDNAETDSARLRRAGAREVAIVSSTRFAIVSELAGEPEPSLGDVIARLSPADLIIVEGYKGEAIPKIEVRRRQSASHEPLAEMDSLVIAIAADHAIDGKGLPAFALDDIVAIADFIVERVRGR